MKKLLVLAAMFLSAHEYVDATFSTGGSKLNIANASNMPVKVSLVGKAFPSGQVSAVIAPNAVGALVYKADTISNVLVSYLKSDNATLIDPVPVSFSPGAVGKNLYVYGNSNVAMSSLDTTVAATPVPSRYVAWWSGNIDVSKYPTAAAAIADTKNVGSLVSLYMMSVDGKNTALPAF